MSLHRSIGLVAFVALLVACGPQNDSTRAESILTSAVGAQYPEEVLTKLETSHHWISWSYLVDNKVMGMASPVPTIEGAKVWTFLRDELSLREETAVSVLRSAHSGENMQWGKATIALSEPMKLEPFALLGTGSETGKLSFRILEEGIELSDGARIVVLIPYAPDDNDKLAHIKPAPGQRGIFTAPLGVNSASGSQALSLFPQPFPEATAFVHHNLSQQRRVVVDSRMLPLQQEALREALSLWNEALGKPYFALTFETRTINISECLFKGELCILWEGGAEVPITGWLGLANVVIDPLTGLVRAGIISFHRRNNADLVDLPSEDAETIRNQAYDVPWLTARALLGQEQLSTIRHPMQKELIRHVFLHEVGHVMGLEHYFAGSNNGDIRHPSSTVMDYLSSLAMPAMNQLGPRDTHLMAVVYQQQASKKEIPCADAEAATLPNCAGGDLGDPAGWILAMARQTKEEIMKAPLLGSGGLLAGMGFRPTIYEALKAYVTYDSRLSEEQKEVMYQQVRSQFPQVPTPKQSAAVVDFLCEQPNHAEITKDLLLDREYELTCPAEMLAPSLNGL